MPLLSLCTELVGTDWIIDPDPTEVYCRNVVFRPFDPVLWLSDPNWGVYFTDGRLVEAASYRRLPRRDLVGQSEAIKPTSKILPIWNGICYYGGPIIPHYGHFLTAALPRMWHILRDGPPKAPILCHSIERPDEWFARPYVAAILGQLGLTPESFIHFREPTVVSRMIVPQPAFEEQHFAHSVLGELCTVIGSKFNGAQTTSGPVYISKAKLGPGSTYRLVNEAVIEQVFSENGIKILHPEMMPIEDQIAALSSASILVGTIGSAFHTTLFCNTPKRIIGLAYDKAINANYALIDKLKGNLSTYVWCPSKITSQPAEGITFGHAANSPEDIARELLSII